MTVRTLCSDSADISLRDSIGIEKIPDLSPYAYAPAWPRILGVELIDVELEAKPEYIEAAAAVLKVAQWSNGSYAKRRWDEVTVPRELPEEAVVLLGETTWTGAPARLPVYNCASLPHFAVGIETLHTVESRLTWRYEPTDLDTKGILRLVPRSCEPETTGISDGHWMIGLDVAKAVAPESPEALDILGSDEPVVLHVNGGDGPILVSPAEAVSDFYARQYDSDMDVYAATAVG